MRLTTLLLALAMTLILSAALAAENSISMKVSGPGVVNDSTLKAGEKVSFDIYTATDTTRNGFTFGIGVKSDDIKSVIHVPDSGNGLNANGDIKGYNGWQNRSVWDMNGIYAVERDWDGQLPDLIGFGGIAIKLGYKKEPEPTKKLSFEMIIPEPGKLVVDSQFFPPGGGWYYASPDDDSGPTVPSWDGPHVFKVIK